MADIIKERAADLALLECIDTGDANPLQRFLRVSVRDVFAGKPVSLAASMDIIRTEENFRTFSILAQVHPPASSPPPPPTRPSLNARVRPQATPNACYDSAVALHMEARTPGKHR